MVQLRNPWSRHDGWNGDYSDAQGGAKYEDLKAALMTFQGGIKIEVGKFWMSFDDFTKEYYKVVIGHSQETRTVGGEERAEYRPSVELNEFSNQHFLRVTLYDEVNLNDDVFVINNFQGGNRLGTDRNPDFDKIKSGRTGYYMLRQDATSNLFYQSWRGTMQSEYRWAKANHGNEHTFTAADGVDGNKM